MSKFAKQFAGVLIVYLRALLGVVAGPKMHHGTVIFDGRKPSITALIKVDSPESNTITSAIRATFRTVGFPKIFVAIIQCIFRVAMIAIESIASNEAENLPVHINTVNFSSHPLCAASIKRTIPVGAPRVPSIFGQFLIFGGAYQCFKPLSERDNSVRTIFWLRYRMTWLRVIHKASISTFTEAYYANL